MSAKKDKTFLIFECANETLAFAADFVKEVKTSKEIHALPCNKSKEIIMGITNINGELVIIANLASILGKTDNSTKTSFIVCEHSNLKIAFLTGKILKMVKKQNCEIAPAIPEKKSKAQIFDESIFYEEQTIVKSLNAELLLQAVARKYL